MTTPAPDPVAAWPAGAAVPATVDSLRAWVGAQGSREDAVLGQVLDAAKHHVYGLIRDEFREHSDVQLAIHMLAARLYKRRQSPEGSAGFGDAGVVRIIARDPDIAALLQQHLNAGFILGIS